MEGAGNRGTPNRSAQARGRFGGRRLYLRGPGGGGGTHRPEPEFGAARPAGHSRRRQRTATVTAGVHVSIVSPLLGDVRRIVVPSPTRSFEALLCGLIRDDDDDGRPITVRRCPTHATGAGEQTLPTGPDERD